MGDDPSNDRAREREAREGESERAVGDTYSAGRKEGPMNLCGKSRADRALDKSTVQSAIGCALQVSWVPALIYTQNVEWSGLPLKSALPIAFYFTGIIASALCVRIGMTPTLKSDTSHTLDIGAIATYLFGTAVLLASNNGLSLACIGLTLVGCSSGIAVLQWERCLACLPRHDTTCVAICSAGIASTAIYALAVLPSAGALVASACFVVASMLIKPRLEYPKKAPSALDSKLLHIRMKSFDLRMGTAMFLLGTASAIPIALFVSSDSSFIGNSAEIARMIASWTPLAFAFFVAIIVAGWIPNRESDAFTSLRALFATALISFFPLSPGSELNMWLVLVFSMVWVVSLAGISMLVSCEVDREYAECGSFSVGRSTISICIGALAGLMIVAFIKFSIPQFSEVVERNSSGTMLVCSLSMICVMVLFVATNVLATKGMLHEVALFGRGKLAFHVPEETIVHAGKQDAADNSEKRFQTAERMQLHQGSIRSTEESIQQPPVVTCCKNIAFEYGLTPRELEVLIILAQGNTLVRVQEELVISEGTAITHRRNIYRKLDIHSKQELIDFVRIGGPSC